MRSTPFYQKCFDEAYLAFSQGISGLPPNENGRKSPLAEPIPQSCDHPDCIAQREAGKKTGWKHRQHRRAGRSLLRRWYQVEHREGLGLICGDVSGGLLLFEFEGRAIDDGTFQDFLDFAEEQGLEDLIERIRDGYEDRSPSGGIHWLIYCDNPISMVLASVDEHGESADRPKWVPLIETRGEGAYAICAPTTGTMHPSGKGWKRLRGGLDKIVRLTDDDLDALYSLARLFDKKPYSEFRPPRGVSTKGGGRPGDSFNEQAAWPDILKPEGWEYLFTDTGGEEHWSRPGKEPQGTSATVSPGDEFLYVFSTATPFEANRSYSKFAAYAILNHADVDGAVDWKEAAAVLRGEGYGTKRRSGHKRGGCPYINGRRRGRARRMVLGRPSSLRQSNHHRR